MKVNQPQLSLLATFLSEIIKIKRGLLNYSNKLNMMKKGVFMYDGILGPNYEIFSFLLLD